MNPLTSYYAPLLQRLAQEPDLSTWARSLPKALAGRAERHGRFEEWAEAVHRLPVAKNPHLDLQDTVRITAPDAVALRPAAERELRRLHPWRKGPFELYGIPLDTEWRSDWKWDRLKDHIQPLRGRRVLDIGCGNGYYGWRMAGGGAQLVIGIDPTLVFVMQFLAVRKLMGCAAPDHWVLPLGIEDLPSQGPTFDTVFSMGVLYHRPDPDAHLSKLKTLLRPGGELVLETLVLNTPEPAELIPPGRYAKMRNVHAVYSPARLTDKLAACGFEDIQTVDITPTTVQEQRSTDWMRFESLADFLDPDDPQRTVEGHPAPVRAVFTARRALQVQG